MHKTSETQRSVFERPPVPFFPGRVTFLFRVGRRLVCTQVTLSCSGAFGALVEAFFRVSDVTLEVRGVVGVMVAVLSWCLKDFSKSKKDWRC